MIKKTLLFMILSMSIFALRTSDINMDIKVKEGEKGSKIFILENAKEYPLRYRLSIENDVYGVKVTPNTLLIPAFSSKSFEVLVDGDTQGEKSYFLILEEEILNLKSEGSNAKIKMKYRIEQKYVVE